MASQNVKEQLEAAPGAAAAAAPMVVAAAGAGVAAPAVNPLTEDLLDEWVLSTRQELDARHSFAKFKVFTHYLHTVATHNPPANVVAYVKGEMEYLLNNQEIIQYCNSEAYGPHLSSTYHSLIKLMLGKNKEFAVGIGIQRAYDLIALLNRFQVNIDAVDANVRKLLVEGQAIQAPTTLPLELSLLALEYHFIWQAPVQAAAAPAPMVVAAPGAGVGVGAAPASTVAAEAHAVSRQKP